MDFIAKLISMVSPNRVETAESSSVASNIVNAYNSVSEDVKAKIRLWVWNIKRVESSPVPSDPEIAKWRADILSRAEQIKSMIRKVISDETAKDLGLGLVPLAIAGGVAISAIVAYMTYQLSDVAKYFERVNFIKTTAVKLESQGVPTAQALTQAINAADSAGQTRETKILGVSVKTIGVALVLVGVAGYFWRRKK